MYEMFDMLLLSEEELISDKVHYRDVKRNKLMADRNPISVTIVHSQVPHNENVQLSRFSKLQNNLKPYSVQADKLPDLDSKKPFTNTPIKTARFPSALSSLISNRAVLARVEANPSLRAAILNNPFLAEIIMNNPALLTAIIKSPELLAAVTNNSNILSSIKDNPGLLSEIIKNPALSIESILERLAKKPETISPPPPHPLEKSTIAAERARPAVRALLSRVKTVGAESLEVQKLQASQVLETKMLEAKSPLKTPMTPALKPAAYFDARLFAINPALLALLGAAAFVSNRGRVVPAGGSLKDVGVELETQSESQPDAIQESDQIEGIGEVGEIHSVSEASI